MTTTDMTEDIISPQERRTALFRIVAKMHPMGVRQTFYQATVLGVVSKTEEGYDTVKHDLVKMRRDGTIPYDWIVDGSRYVIQAGTFDGPQDALADLAKTYRKSLWTDMDCRVQIWIEKDALTGVVSPVTMKYDVPLYPARGYSSISFLYEAAQDLNSHARNYVYHFGDFDPSGVDAAEKVEKELRMHVPDADVVFTRAAVTPVQIREWDLPSRPTKKSDTRAAKFGSEISVELDALPPDTLRGLVESIIKKHLKPRHYKALIAEQERERNLIAELVKKF
jgi:hypothetical protein